MPATIPSDRPVLGRDLETLRERLQRTVLDCCCLLGIPPTLWAEWKRNEAKPIPNPTVALAVRLYDGFPELAPVEPSLGVLRALLAEITGRRIPLTELSVFLGREKTSGYRWQSRGDPSMMVSRLTQALIQLLERQGHRGFAAYHQLLTQEAAARGIANLMETGAWKRKAAPDGEESEP